MIDLLTVEYEASGAIPEGHLVILGAKDGQVTVSAANNAVIGVARKPGAAATDERVAVGHLGVYPVKAGGNVSRGHRVKADAAGKGVTAVAGDSVIGIALVDASPDDLFDVLVVPGAW